MKTEEIADIRISPIVGTAKFYKNVIYKSSGCEFQVPESVKTKYKNSVA
jgi:hypothetical protein